MAVRHHTDEKIRVLHVCDKFGVAGSSIHGVSRALSRWIPRLDGDRFETLLAGLRAGGPAQEELASMGIEVRNLDKGKFDFGTIGAINELAEEFEADLLHLHGYGAANFGRIAGLLTGTPTMVHEHVVDPNMPFYQVPWDVALSRVPVLSLACSEAVRNFMVRRRHFPAERVKVLMYGTPLSRYRPVDDDEIVAEKEKWGIPTDHRVVGAIGRMDTQKGYEYLIDAAPAILGEHPDVSFMMVGDGPLLEDLRQRTRERGVADAFVFTGYASDVVRPQSTFDVEAFPSLWEGTPLTIFEAMAMARPIVSTPVDGIREVLHDGRNALVVSPRDTEDLAGAIRRLLSDPDLATRLAAKAREDSHRYGIEGSVRRLEEHYERALAS